LNDCANRQTTLGQDPLLAREDALRAWFTRDADPILAEIDGLDIGWGDVQRWAAARMPGLGAGLHLDVACGYATFLAQLGWRFPAARLVGLNIDFEGPHALAPRLLAQAGVRASLVRGDARRLPFREGCLDSLSCFLGLQDIEIGFGQEGVRQAVAQAARVLRPGGTLVLLDEFSFERLAHLLQGLPLQLLGQAERPVDVRWPREVAERAVNLYAHGYVSQARVEDPQARSELYERTHARMRADMERQFRAQGCFVPTKAVRMITAVKTGTEVNADGRRQSCRFHTHARKRRRAGASRCHLVG